MRHRYITKQQYTEEFGDAYNDHLKEIWESCKSDYLEEKHMLDCFINSSNNSQYYKDCISAMDQVIQDELDSILLGDETDSIDK